MQQDNNHIENKLRQLENQQLPDLSAMDAHWKDMQTALVSHVNPKQKSSYLKNNWQKLLIAASIIAAIMTVYLVKYYGKSNEVIAITKDKNQIPSINAATTAITDDTTIKVIAGVVKMATSNPIKIKTSVVVLQKDSFNKTILVKKIDSIVMPMSIPQISFDTFYAQIQKPIQEFIIDASIGGEIVGKQGTKISIPSAAFYEGDGKVTTGKIQINLEEYYKYSDMIAANLVTTSNGQQLLTGGMIKITATQNGVELNIRNEKALNLSMPTSNYDPQMELFYGEKKNNNEASYAVNTGAANNKFNKRVNWWVAGFQTRYPLFDGTTNVIAFEDKPYKVRNSFGKVIGKFNIPITSPYTVEEAKAILKEKYGDSYDKIKVRKVKSYTTRHRLFSRKFVAIENKSTGDSTKMSVAYALTKGHIQKKDSLFYTQKTIADSLRFVKNIYAQILQDRSRMPFTIRVDYRPSTRDTLANFYMDTLQGDYKKYADSINKIYAARMQVEERYNFTVKQMGWINCDRFSNYDNKTDFVLDLPTDVQADKFVTQIVFTKIRSVMPGQYQQNKIGFLNIPVDMPVYVVGLGERNGKVVSFMQPFKTSAKNVPITTLEETTPEAFKEKLKQLDL